MTPLMMAARESAHPEVVDVLARASAQSGCLDAVDGNGNSALMHAAMKTASAEIVRRLMENNANPNMENADNADALHLIKHNKNFFPADSVVWELADFSKSYTPPSPLSGGVKTSPTVSPPDEAKPAMASTVMVLPVPGSGRITGDPFPNNPPRTTGSEPAREPSLGSTPPPVGQQHKPQEDSKPDQNQPAGARPADEPKRHVLQGPWPLLMILAGLAMIIGAVRIIRKTHKDPAKRQQLIVSAILGFIGVIVFMSSPYWVYSLAIMSAPDWIANNFLHGISLLAVFSTWLYPNLRDPEATTAQAKFKNDADAKEDLLHYPAMADKSNPKSGEKPRDPA